MKRSRKFKQLFRSMVVLYQVTRFIKLVWDWFRHFSDPPAW